MPAQRKRGAGAVKRRGAPPPQFEHTTTTLDGLGGAEGRGHTLRVGLPGPVLPWWDLRVRPAVGHLSGLERVRPTVAVGRERVHVSAAPGRARKAATGGPLFIFGSRIKREEKSCSQIQFGLLSDI